MRAGICLRDKRICVTGGAGFLGRAVCARLRADGVDQIFIPRSSEFDLTRADAVARLFDFANPDIVIHLSAQVGGIGANQRHPGRYFHDNMGMGLNLIEASRRHGVEKFIQIGTVCSYPADCPVPFREEDLWSGFPEETNAPYGIAKRALGAMLEAYAREYGLKSVYLIPVNLFGPGDNFDPETSHVIPAMVRKFCEAADKRREMVECWGSGEVTREFLYVEDAAEAIVSASELFDRPVPINLGTGREIRIGDLAAMIARLCDFRGQINWDRSRPDGQRRRALDTSRAEKLLGWRARTDLQVGLERTIQWWRTQGVRASAAHASSGM